MSIGLLSATCLSFIGHILRGCWKTGDSLAVSHPFREVEDGNMADYHLLSEKTKQLHLDLIVEEVLDFLTLNLSPITLLSRTP
jgi:hypothetical protein